MSTIDFWYEFASTYSYPAATRLTDAATGAGVAVRWHPFLLGPIFAAQGLATSPFNAYPVKGRYMWRDMQRICARQGLAFRQPVPFPQVSLLAARTATALDDAARPAFTVAVYAAQFAYGRDISQPETLGDILDRLGHDGQAVMARASSQAVKASLRGATEEAQRLGIFGAPAFITADGELFWGNDRLDEALAWASNSAGPRPAAS